VENVLSERVVAMAKPESHATDPATASANESYPRRWKGPNFKHDLVPAKVEKAAKTKKRLATDDEESDKVKARSKGQCEVVWFGRKARRVQRCTKRGSQVHHMIGGWGKRARGISILADHKQHVCDHCHPLITGHVLRRVGGDLPLWTDEYERVDK
jgi:hypothetical protein